MSSLIATTAAEMTAGTFSADIRGSMTGWTTAGFGGGHILTPTASRGATSCTGVSYLNEYMSKGFWDPISKKLGYIGQCHGSCLGGEMVLFDDATNTWSLGPWPDSEDRYAVNGNHAYHHNTGVRSSGRRYFRMTGSYHFYRIDPGDSAWTAIADSTNNQFDGGPVFGNAAEWHEAAGRLIHVEGNWGVRSYNPGTDTWSIIALTNPLSGLTAPYTLQTFTSGVGAWYSYVHNIMLIGENTAFWKLASDGTTFSTIQAPPFDIGSYEDSGSLNRGIMFVDPVSGDFIAINASGQLYKYNVTGGSADTWSSLGITAPAVISTGSATLHTGDGCVCIPVETYGITVFVKYSGTGNQGVFLYKHAESDEEEAAVTPRFAALMTN